jgi:serine/threonine-protein kinase
LASSRAGVKIAVPNLIGLPQAQAESALRASGLAVGSVSSSNPGNNLYTLGAVIGQSPGPGTQVDASSTVNMVVRK